MSDATPDPVDPHTLYSRMRGLEHATALAVALLARDNPAALDRFEDLAVRINPPDQDEVTRKVFTRMSKTIRDYQGILDEMDKSPGE